MDLEYILAKKYILVIHNKYVHNIKIYFYDILHANKIYDKSLL